MLGMLSDHDDVRQYAADLGAACRSMSGGDDGRSGRTFRIMARGCGRARLGLICGIATVSMVFISLTSAYVVRQGLPTFDGATNSYVRDWGQVQLPWLLLAINTALLLISSLTMEFARRDIKRRAALAPLQSMPGISLGEEKHFPWLGVTVVLGLDFWWDSGWRGGN